MQDTQTDPSQLADNVAVDPAGQPAAAEVQSLIDEITAEEEAEDEDEDDIDGDGD